MNMNKNAKLASMILPLLAMLFVSAPAFADDYGPRPLRYGITSPWWTFDALFLCLALLRSERLVIIGKQQARHAVLGFDKKFGLRAQRGLPAGTKYVPRARKIISRFDFVAHRCADEFRRRNCRGRVLPICAAWARSSNAARAACWPTPAA